MRSIGIRELRQEASRFLREVEAGETFQVTDRGRPIAWLSPIVPDGTRAHLAATGRLRTARRRRTDLGAPLPADPSRRSPSEVLTDLREHER